MEPAPFTATVSALDREYEQRMPTERSSPYIWVTWLSKLLAGDGSCEWASWFKGHYERSSYRQIPDTFDSASWQVEHTSLVNTLVGQLEVEGKTVYRERQNAFTLSGKVTTVGGRPDIIALSAGAATVYDVKTGPPKTSDQVQLMIYMYAVPLAFPQYEHVGMSGAVVYRDHTVDIPADAVGTGFLEDLLGLILRLSSPTPARRVPSASECGFCEITTEDCPERVESEQVSEGQTTDF